VQQAGDDEQAEGVALDLRYREAMITRQRRRRRIYS